MKNSTKILRAYAARLDNNSLNAFHPSDEDVAAIRLATELGVGIDRFAGMTFPQIICFGLQAVHEQAEQLGLATEPVQVEECGPEVAPSLEQLRNVFDQFARLNAQVWPAEEVFEAESEVNRPFRKLGRAMHALYHLMKFHSMSIGGSFLSDPSFNPIFQECLQRASAGEEIAERYLLEHWGMCMSAK